MIVRTVARFKDLKENTFREIGDTFEVTEQRFDEINSTKYGIFVEKVKESQKTVEEVKEPQKTETTIRRTRKQV